MQIKTGKPIAMYPSMQRKGSALFIGKWGMKLPVAVLFLLLCVPLLSQPAKDMRYYEKNYPDEPAVEVLRKQSLQVRMVAGKPEIYIEKYVETILLTDRVTAFANEKVYYSPDNDIMEIEAWSLIPQGNRYKKIEVKDFAHSSDFSNYIFYDDTKVCSFTYPSLTKGSKIAYRVREKITDLYFIHPMYMAQGFSVDKSEITIEYDKAFDMLFNEMAIKPGELKTDTKENGQMVTIRKELDHIPAMKNEDHVESFLRYIPMVIPRIARYRLPGKDEPVKVLSSLNDLYKLYWGFVKNIARHDDAHLQPLVDSITHKSRTEFDKVKAIYYWVQHNIRYVAIEDGANGYVPTDAALVCSKRYGDCKGMSNLMRVMLEKAGIRSYLTWVGTNDLPYKYTEIASPVVDNHMILCYFDEKGKAWLLDATAEFQSIASVPPPIQGKECLVGIDSVTYKVLTIPYSDNLMSQRIAVELKGATLNIRMQQNLTGSFRQRFAYTNAHKTAEDKRRIFERELAADGYAKSAVDKVEHGNLYAVDDTLQVTAAYRLTDYAVVSNGTIYLKVFLNIPANDYIDPAQRQQDFEMDERQEYRWTQSIAIPDGYQAEYLPEKVVSEHPLFSFGADVVQSSRNIIITARYQTDFSTLPRTDYDQWNEMNNQVRQFCSQSIVLKKK